MNKKLWITLTLITATCLLIILTAKPNGSHAADKKSRIRSMVTRTTQTSVAQTVESASRVVAVANEPEPVDEEAQTCDVCNIANHDCVAKQTAIGAVLGEGQEYVTWKLLDQDNAG